MNYYVQDIIGCSSVVVHLSSYNREIKRVRDIYPNPIYIGGRSKTNGRNGRVLEKKKDRANFHQGRRELLAYHSRW